MFGNVDAVAVVEHRDGAILPQSHLDLGNWRSTCLAVCNCLRHADLMVAAVNQPFVEQLEQTWDRYDGLPFDDWVRRRAA